MNNAKLLLKHLGRFSLLQAAVSGTLSLILYFGFHFLWAQLMISLSVCFTAITLLYSAFPIYTRFKLKKAIIMAAKTNDKETLEALIPKVEQHIRSNALLQSASLEAFRAAAQNDHDEAINWLLENVATCNTLLTAGNCEVFQWAARNGHHAIVTLLLDATQNNPNMRNKLLTANHCGAFQAAAKNNHGEVVDLIFKAAADDATRNTFIARNSLAFQVAADNGRHAVVELILKAATDDATRNILLTDRDCAAFRWAAESGHDETVKHLLDNAPNENIRAQMLKADNYGALRAALGDNQQYLAALLIETITSIGLEEGMRQTIKKTWNWTARKQFANHFKSREQYKKVHTVLQQGNDSVPPLPAEVASLILGFEAESSNRPVTGKMIHQWAKPSSVQIEDDEQSESLNSSHANRRGMGAN